MTEQSDDKLVAELNRSSTDPDKKIAILPGLAGRFKEGAQLPDEAVVGAVTRLACAPLDDKIRDAAYHTILAILATHPEQAPVVAKIAGDYARKEIPYQQEAANRILVLIPGAKVPERPVDRVRQWLQGSEP